MIINALSIDVEDYFQVAAFETNILKENWGKFPVRVQKNTERLLSILDGKGIKATFFVLGWVAERYPGLIRTIVEHGHELASHGYMHDRINHLTPEKFRADIKDSKHMLEDIAGHVILGYRAPSYSIGESTKWALDIIEEEGFIYSSSIYPIRHDLYGWPEAPRFAFTATNSGLVEIPISTLSVMGKMLPIGGGGYFRFYPYCISKWLIQRLNHTENEPCIFYLHPWELDPEQPRQKNASFKSRFRHYLNLNKTESRFIQLLDDFKWGAIRDVFNQHLQS
jgi:polysaccharide deacetylase family protein (PEP-CTERM system associated)